MIDTITTFKRSFFVPVVLNLFYDRLNCSDSTQPVKTSRFGKNKWERERRKRDDRNISGEEPEAPKVTAVSVVFSVKEERNREREKQQVKDHRSNVRRGISLHH